MHLCCNDGANEALAQREEGGKVVNCRGKEVDSGRASQRHQSARSCKPCGADPKHDLHCAASKGLGGKGLLKRKDAGESPGISPIKICGSRECTARKNYPRLAISDAMVQEKALEITTKLNIDGDAFKASSASFRNIRQDIRSCAAPWLEKLNILTIPNFRSGPRILSRSFSILR